MEMTPLKKSNYNTPKDKIWLRAAIVVKGISGAFGASAILANSKYLALAVLAAGAIANEIINFTGKKNEAV